MGERRFCSEVLLLGESLFVPIPPPLIMLEGCGDGDALLCLYCINVWLLPELSSCAIVCEVSIPVISTGIWYALEVVAASSLK
jgi:hypothetical protein